MLVNVKIDSNNIITSWRKAPLNYEEPIIDLQDDERIYVGFSQAVVRINSDTRLIKVPTGYVREWDDETHEYVIKATEEEKRILVYDFVENKELFEQNIIDISDEKKYSHLVEKLIRKRYSVSDELAILRQRDTKVEEFEVYNTYTEECKQKAKEIIENE